MKHLLATVAISMLAGCGQDVETTRIDRPVPPHFVADGNAPSPAVAIDFINKYTAAIQAAVVRTPYTIKDADEQMRTAQEMYKADREYLGTWVNAGVVLFQAAHSNTCETFVRGGFATWEQAYPLNGPPSQAALDKKREYAARTEELRGFCVHATTLSAWGS